MASLHWRYEIWWLTCKQKSPNHPIHWMIMLLRPGEKRGIWLHCTGTDGNYMMKIERNKRFDSWSLEWKTFICTVSSSMLCTIERHARSIPPQSCQRWATYLIQRLELAGLAPHRYHMEMRSYMTTARDDLGIGCLNVG